MHLIIEPGDTINIIGSFTPCSSPSSQISSIVITSKHNLLILHLDLLLMDTTPALLWGNMLHEVVQACLSSGNWDESWIDKKIDQAIRLNLAELIKINIGVEQDG